MCAVANVLKSWGVKKGDTVSVYLPMTWHAVATFLACARIGAVHSVVFAGFSAESLRDRVQDCKSRVLITSDEGRRGGKTIAIAGEGRGNESDLEPMGRWMHASLIMVG